MKQSIFNGLFVFTLFCQLTLSAQTLYLSQHFTTAQEAKNIFAAKKPTLLWDLHGVLFDKPFLSLARGIWNIQDKPKFIIECCNAILNGNVRNGLILQWKRKSKITQSYFDTTKGYAHMHTELIKLANNMYIPNTRTYQLVNKLKKLRYNQYLFSNIGPEILADLQTTYPAYFVQFNQLHNTINPVTPNVQKWINKPDAQAYQKALEKIDQQETPWMVLFVDDKEENIKKAQELGMNALLFITPEQLHNDLTSFLSL